jgi:hypothetical protein
MYLKRIVALTGARRVCGDTLIDWSMRRYCCKSAFPSGGLVAEPRSIRHSVFAGFAYHLDRGNCQMAVLFVLFRGPSVFSRFFRVFFEVV